MMWFIRHLSVLIIVLFWSCSPVSEKSLQFRYIVQSIDPNRNEMSIRFELINHTDLSFENASWQFHWNQMKGTVIASSLPKGITYIHVNGDNYMYLQFDERWRLPPRDTLVFELKQRGIMDRLVMGPVGAFIVNEHSQHDLETSIIWQGATNLSALDIPTATDRYESLEGIYMLPKDSLLGLVPQPLHMQVTKTYRPKDRRWNISIDPQLNGHSSKLISLMSSLFQQEITFDSKGSSNFSIRYNNSLSAEAYHLEIAEKSIYLESADYPGLVYALQSLHQLIDLAEIENASWPILQIEDAPRFNYRGFLVDIARNYYGLSKLKQVVDLMSQFKLNHLDLRLTDDEGWRIEIEGLPELTSVGSKRGFTQNELDRLIPMYGSGAHGSLRSDGFLTQSEFKELLSYAALRNVQIIPQISFPSHARAAVKAMESRYHHYLNLGDSEKANEFLLTDLEDQSTYRSAQNYDDNIVCICNESAYNFYEKVVSSITKNYDEADVPLTIFSIGADEVPYGAWQKSPICQEFLAQNKDSISTIPKLYSYNLRRLKHLFDRRGITMAGWEDILLDHSNKSQGETKIAEETLNYEAIPFVWNTSWGEGREDMIYKMANAGFTPIMSNSSAFYFDMADDKDMEGYGLNWSGYVDYIDAWGINPLDVFSNLSFREKHHLHQKYIDEHIKLNPDKTSNFLGIQGQLWTETARTESIFDELLLPNLIVLAERAWAPSPLWHEISEAKAQKKMSLGEWNVFSNTLGQRILPLISYWYPSIAYHLPKPGAKIIDGQWKVRTVFPGLKVHYSVDNETPTSNHPFYTKPLSTSLTKKLHLRVFDQNQRGGKSILSLN